MSGRVHEFHLRGHVGGVLGREEFVGRVFFEHGLQEIVVIFVAGGAYLSLSRVGSHI